MKEIKAMLVSAAIIGLSLTSAVAQTTAEEKEPFKPKFAIGVNTPEWSVGNGYLGGKFIPTSGLTFEAQLTKHSGFEYGVYNRMPAYHILAWV